MKQTKKHDLVWLHQNRDDLILDRLWKPVWTAMAKRMRLLGVEPRISRPQRELLTTILQTPGEVGYRSLYLPHAKRALYHLSYIPIISQLCSPSRHTNFSTTHKIFSAVIHCSCFWRLILYCPVLCFSSLNRHEAYVCDMYFHIFTLLAGVNFVMMIFVCTNITTMFPHWYNFILTIPHTIDAWLRYSIHKNGCCT